MESTQNSECKAAGTGKSFWAWAAGSLMVRVLLICSPLSSSFSLRPEVSTPLTSIRRLAEGYWLKQSSMSPYAGPMYHGSPLLLHLLGPLILQSDSFEMYNRKLCRFANLVKISPIFLANFFFDPLFLSQQLIFRNSFPFLIADIASAVLLRKCGQLLHSSYRLNLQDLEIAAIFKSPGDIAALTYLWNPLTIVSCVGLSTSSIDNVFVILALYGACSGNASLAAIGWVIASHLSLYPIVLIIPVILLLVYGPDTPPRKLFVLKNLEGTQNPNFYKIFHFFCWAILWLLCILTLCHTSIKEHSNLWEMLRRTHGFTLAVEDLSPNIGVLWYFFAEAFDFFRSFFLLVFHINILFMLLPLAIRIPHRPFFLAFTYVAISSMLKSYPSVGDCALCLGLLTLFSSQLADMKFSFFLSCGYVGVFLFSPVMHNLWIWRGTGNANFYFATAIGYSCLEILLIMDSVSTMLHHDRMLRKLVITSRKVE